VEVEAEASDPGGDQGVAGSRMFTTERDGLKIQAITCVFSLHIP
jgi:hypothetical protein